ncbi:DUF2877 domain-containing protein [Nocardioides aestuarii]|uniref:DUF2877 domain-containing protein n=1 Tax=Nocardioides aestuarii TaxID=252231 RepID=A0ABW4TNW1_9ACTN
MTPVAAPPRVRDLLRTAPDGPVPVLHAGPLAIYVEVAGQAVGVLAAGAVRVPCGLRTRLKDLALHVSTNGGPDPYVVGGALHLGSRPLTVGRVVGTYVPTLRHEVVRSTKTGPATVQATPPATVAGLVAALPRRRDDATGLPALVGRGEGLTPLGDDLLCGWLATQRALGVATPAVDAELRRLLSRTTRLSATLLECALAGETLPEHADWLRAVGGHDEPARARALAAIGATSGSGLLHGSRAALDQLREAA